jgi:endophilin-B
LFFPSGSTLIKCGQIHQKLGQTYKDFIQSAAMGYIQPLKSYLEGEMKSITVNI